MEKVRERLVDYFNVLFQQNEGFQPILVGSECLERVIGHKISALACHVF